MALYDFLALLIDALHWVLIFFWIGGFFISKYRYPKTKTFHSLLGIIILPVQMIFSFRCPLTLLSGYLREISHPNTLNSYHQPFVINMLRDTFGLSVPDVCITLAIVLGFMVAVWTLLTVKLSSIKAHS